MRYLERFEEFTERHRGRLRIGAAWVALLCTGCLFNRVNDALMAPDRYLEGALVKVEEDERYEWHCGVLSRFFGCRESPRALVATVRDSAGKEATFFMFAFTGDSIPKVGLYAYWHLHRREVTRLGQCNAYTCPTDVAYCLDSDQDVRRP